MKHFFPLLNDNGFSKGVSFVLDDLKVDVNNLSAEDNIQSLINEFYTMHYIPE